MNQVLELAVGDKLAQSAQFAEGFTSDTRRKMVGRHIVVSRVFSVTAVFGDGKMAELDFIAPTKRHKPFRMSFSLRDIEFYLARGELVRR